MAAYLIKLESKNECKNVLVLAINVDEDALKIFKTANKHAQRAKEEPYFDMRKFKITNVTKVDFTMYPYFQTF